MLRRNHSRRGTFYNPLKASTLKLLPFTPAMPATPNRPIISLASRLSEAARGFLLQALAKAGHPDIEPCHGDIFAVLFSGDALGLTELAHRTGRCKSTVSVMVRRLTALGYLEKVRDEKDTRAVLIRLTDSGKALEPVFASISAEMAEILEEGLTAKELETLEALLARSIACFAKTSK